MYANTRTRASGPRSSRRIMLGTYALSSGYYDAYYLKAPQVRTLMRRDFDEAFKTCDGRWPRRWPPPRPSAWGKRWTIP